MLGIPRPVFVGWVTRLLLFMVGPLLIRAGFTSEETAGFMPPLAELVTGAVMLAGAVAWSYAQKRKLLEAKNDGNALLKFPPGSQQLVLPAVVVLSLAMAGCATPQQRYNTAQESFIAALRTLNAARSTGAISEADWQTVVVPMVNAADQAFDDAWSALKSGNQNEWQIHVDLASTMVRRMVQVIAAIENKEKLHVAPDSRSGRTGAVDRRLSGEAWRVDGGSHRKTQRAA